MIEHMSEKDRLSGEIAPDENGRSRPNRALSVDAPSPLEIAGQIANRVAGDHVFRRYLEEKAANTRKRQARDLELFAEYLLDARIPLENGADFQHDPAAWQGVTWGIVEGFVAWLLQEGYAISTVNARLYTVRTYARLAMQAGAISGEEGARILNVKGLSRRAGLNVDEGREQTRIDEVTYAYKPDGEGKRVVVNRRSTKKQGPTTLDEETAVLLKQPRNDSPQAYRDALMMCLLLDHGLRASEAALIPSGAIDLAAGVVAFHRPKVQGTEHEWTTHKLTPDTRRVVAPYLQELYPAALDREDPLLLGTTRLCKDGSGGELRPSGLNRVRISERVAWLGEQLGIDKLSAHDCRHYCATTMAQLGYGVDELLAWFGWTTAQTAMRYVAAADVQERDRG